MVRVHWALYVGIEEVDIYIDIKDYFTKYYKYTRSRENALKTLEAICKDDQW